QNTGIPGTLFPDLAGGEYFYHYYLSEGSWTDPMTGYSLNNAVLVYDYLQNQYHNNQWPFLPTSYGQYTDKDGVTWMRLGSEEGQVYRVNPAATDDDGEAIEAYMEGLSIIKQGFKDNKDYRAWVHTNPGCQAKLQFSLTNNLNQATRQWFDVGDLTSGITYVEF